MGYFIEITTGNQKITVIIIYPDLLSSVIGAYRYALSRVSKCI